jgi:molybdate transport system regulatory protein
MKRPRPAFKLWLETDEGYVFGPGVFSLLKKIDETGTLKGAAQSLGMSYRYAWGLIRRAEETLGEPLISASKGGRLGGGRTENTELGRHLVEDFERLKATMTKVSAVLEAAAVEGVVRSIAVSDGEAHITISLDRRDVELTLEAEAVKGLAEGDAVKVGLHLS